MNGFYGHPNTNKRKESWGLLNRLNLLNCEWCIFGDFNEILFNNEKKEGKIRLESHMVSFKNAILENNLLDLNFIGDKFEETSVLMVVLLRRGWIRSLQHREWKIMFLDVRVDVSSAITSNLKPLILSIWKSNWRKVVRTF